MSEQLSLEGLVGSGDAAKSPKTKTKYSPEIQSRIDGLAAQKAKIDHELQELPAFNQFKAEPLIKEDTIPVWVDAPHPATVAASKPEPQPTPEPVKEPEPEILTVSQLNKGIKGILEKSFPFLWVKGEISNLKIPASGHIYFTLKDAGAQIRAVMFKGFAQSLKFKPQDGMEVVIRCKVTVYEPRGDYQIFCEAMEPVGFGALQIAFEQLKAKLQNEGLFDPKRKRPLPAYPTRLGIVTSPTGAAIRDMLNILSRRHGSLDISIIPTSVQGDKAPGEIVKAIEFANSLGTARFDVLIVGRGGGSLEDLWAFNDEGVARAVAGSKIPVISAVGHEVDFTICDFVADLRAPTPSAAAELVVKNKADLVERIGLHKRQITQLIVRHVKLHRSQFEGLTKRLVDPKRKLQDLMLRCDEWTQRMEQAISRLFKDRLLKIQMLSQKMGTPERQLQIRRDQVQFLSSKLELLTGQIVHNKKSVFKSWVGLLNGLSPLAILERGYSIVKKGDEIVKAKSQVTKGDVVALKLHEGETRAQILE